MAGHVYDRDIYAFERRPQHYWATTGSDLALPDAPLLRDVDVDVAIIGGGYAGLSAAQSISQHGMSAAVLEAGVQIGWGASGCNGGFVSMGGSMLSLSEMRSVVGVDETRRYWRTQTEAVLSLRDLIDQHRIACDVTGEGNLCVADHPAAAAALQTEALDLTSMGGIDCRFIAETRLKREYLDSPEAKGGMLLKPGFGVHPFRLAIGLAHLATQAGVELYTSAEVVEWQKNGRTHRLITSEGRVVHAGKVIVATNGYTPNALKPRLGFRVLPAISSIIVTQAYGNEELNRRGFVSTVPIYTSKNLLSYYRRLPDGRILFGRRGDTIGTASSAEAQAALALKTLKRTLPAFCDARIESHWRGLVALTSRRTLSMGTDPADSTVSFVFGCHGSGIATMTWAGRLLAEIASGHATLDDIPAVFRGLSSAFPPSNLLLRWGLRSAYAYYGLKDTLHI